MVILAVLAVAIALPLALRAQRQRAANACANNLRQIHAAMVSSALANRYRVGDTMPTPEFTLYMKGSTLPACPSGGEYFIPTVGGHPGCSVHGDFGLFDGPPGPKERAILGQPTPGGDSSTRADAGLGTPQE